MRPYEALQHAVRAHNTDTDWGGQLYVLHPIAVADRVDQNWDKLPPRIAATARFGRASGIIVGLLHDVLEDTKYNFDRDDLTPLEWRALLDVTRLSSETYFSYVRNIAWAAEKGEPLGAVVKLADLSHNMSAERKVGLTDEQLETAAGLEKDRYIPSRDMLWEAIGSEWWPA